MELRRLGRTGHASSVVVLGGAAFASSTADEARAPFHAALARGVNHLDVAPRYGEAERALGPHLPSVRDRLFVGCKTTRRNPDGVRAQMEESLARLRIDSFDLYQLHAVTDVGVLEERTKAVEAVLRARDEGLARFVGITGHDLGSPAAHAEAVRRWDLDTVMFPVNPHMWSDDAYRRDAEALLELCAERDIGVMAIKACARRPWDDRDRFATTWYEPYDQAGEISRCVRFTLSVPGVHALCSPGDLGLLEPVLDAASSFEPIDDLESEVAAADEASIFPIPTG